MKETDFIRNTLDFSHNLDISLIKKFIVFDEIDSTNIKAKELAINGEEEGTVIISQIQKKGKGRFDRKWESPQGGVYLSIILRPKSSPEKSMLISLLTAIVIAKTISSYNLSPKIKWPNDIRVGGKKIAGVLIESEADQNRLKYIVIGMGINLNIKLQNLSYIIRKNSTSLLEEIGTSSDYFDFLESLLMNFDYYYNIFINNKFERIILDWKNLSDTIGKKVIINPSLNPIEGEVIGIDESGFLIVSIETDKHKTISSGELIYFEN
jgi:BirA family biotin operon repressor/biotin-[acetyl-CoA-carboxylase] ligase